MKLYTEEQVRRAMLHSYLSGVERPADYLPIEESILMELTPIEIPSDEEIRKESHNYFMRGQLGFEAAADTERAFLRGVLWLIDKILNK